MIVSYCTSCLPNKVVLGYSGKVADIRNPHAGHPQRKKNGYFPISLKEWKAVFVEGDEAQTKANIVAQFQSRMV